MNICIVGTGASGWIAYHQLKHLKFIKKIIVIGSPTIPKIGVGESTTVPFREFTEKKLGLTNEEYFNFLIDIDAAFKYGVNYEGWGAKNFLHAFPSITESELTLYAMGKKSQDDNFNDYNIALIKEIYKNNVCIDPSIQNYTFHFDANKFIETMKRLSQKDEKIEYVEATVTDSIYHNGYCTKLILDTGEKITADYFISCIGQTAFNQKVFKDEYISYSDKLLTTKALFYPLEYKNKKKEMHPYTVAKTMKHGWRWITPTLSRIGTGYVFSDNHVSIDEAINEFVTDIGDPSIEPNCIDFYPRRVKEVFKINTCTMGMASGFLEPLDAPGLAATIGMLEELEEILTQCNQWGIPNGDAPADHPVISTVDQSNKFWQRDYNEWCSFILHQYKTCHRTDTEFWIDHKNVQFDFYNEITKSIFDPKIKYHTVDDVVYLDYDPYVREPIMFFKTTAGKDVQWKVKIDITAPKIESLSMINPLLLYNQAELFDKIKLYYGR
jgi:tryptophan halogenase